MNLCAGEVKLLGKMHPNQLTIDLLRPWLEVRFSRGHGPGGQNVNKVNTRVTLIFDFQSCPMLTPPQIARLRQASASRLTRAGRLYFAAREDRSQSANRALADERLMQWLREVLKPLKKRRPTQPTQGARQRRLKDKKRRGATKRLRGQRPESE